MLMSALQSITLLRTYVKQCNALQVFTTFASAMSMVAVHTSPATRTSLAAVEQPSTSRDAQPLNTGTIVHSSSRNTVSVVSIYTSQLQVSLPVGLVQLI